MWQKTVLLSCFFLLHCALHGQPEPGDSLQVFELAELTEELRDSERPWLGFFRNDNLITGLYTLEAGATDQQSPHDTDEIYYVIEGSGEFECDGKIVSVQPGTILYVPAHAIHRFLNIEAKLTMLVFFD